MKNRHKYKLAAFFLCLIMMVFCTQVSAFADTEWTGFEDLKGKTAGVMTGTPQDAMVKDNIENPNLLYFNSMTDMALALNEGKIDYFVNSTIAFRIMQESYPEFGYIDQVLRSFDMGAIFPQTDKGKALCDEFNAFIKEKQQDGTLDQLKEYWLYPKDWENIDIPTTGEKGTIKMALSSAMKPFAFVLNGDYAGFDVAVVSAFCQESGYALVIEDALFDGVLSGVSTGKYDIAAGQISYTEERAKSVLFSDFYCQQDIVPVIKSGSNVNGSSIQDTSNEGSDNANNNTNVSKSKTLGESIKRTLVDENRWKLILSGLVVTIIITVCGFVLANILGALFCAMTLSKKKMLNITADVYSRIMQGTPIVVVLMILYYIVFGNTKVSGVIVAIIGFGITMGAYVAQLFAGSIKGVDPGQREAALAIGFTRRQAFTGIVLPQAIRSMLPGYFSELISLMKGTAIVGYIAVSDLTKTGDIIRSSTFEPFVPLIVVALIYFGIACMLLSILKRIQKKLEPKRVKSKEEGSKI